MKRTNDICGSISKLRKFLYGYYHILSSKQLRESGESNRRRIFIISVGNTKDQVN